MSSPNEDWENYEVYTGLALGALGVGLGAALYARRGPAPQALERDLVGKSYVVTGANVGIGKATAAALVARGGKVILKALPEAEPSNIEVAQLDLASFRSIESFAETVKASPLLGGKSLTCLVNNAGAMVPTFSLSHTGAGQGADDGAGLEKTMLTNFLGPLHLTKCLESALTRGSRSCSSGSSSSSSGGSPSRVVNVSSRLEKQCQLSDEALAAGPTGALAVGQQYGMTTAYADSKHAFLLASLGLARQQQQGYGNSSSRSSSSSSPYVVHSVTPGMVNTNLSRFLRPPLSWLAWPLQRLLLRTPEQGAAPVVYAATAAQPGLLAESGKYYASDKAGVCTAIAGSERTGNAQLAAKVLESSLGVIAAARKAETAKVVAE